MTFEQWTQAILDLGIDEDLLASWYQTLIIEWEKDATPQNAADLLVGLNDGAVDHYMFARW